MKPFSWLALCAHVCRVPGVTIKGTSVRTLMGALVHECLWAWAHLSSHFHIVLTSTHSSMHNFVHACPYVCTVTNLWQKHPCCCVCTCAPQGVHKGPPIAKGGWLGHHRGYPPVTATPVPQFLAMLSQWCTQMHSLTLQNLKPRQRGKKESKEDYMKSTR